MRKELVLVCGSYLQTFEKACQAKKVDSVAALSQLGVNENAFLKNLKSRKGPSALELKRICDYFEITADSFLSGFIDLKWIACPTLPEKYQFSSGSKFLTSLVILDYVQRKHGDVFLNNDLRTLKIPRDWLSRPDKKVSIRLLSDLLRYLAARGFDYNEFTNTGRHSVDLNENAKVKKHFEGLSERAVFEKLFEEVVLQYEENFDYKIVSSGDRSIHVQVNAKDSRVDDFQSARIDNLFVSFYRQGVCAAHLKHVGLPIAYSEIISSLHAGDLTEQFKVAW